MDDCGKTEVFLQEWDRMCNYYNKKPNECRDCGLHFSKNGEDAACGGFVMRFSERAIAIVKEWSDAHPKKTRQSEFLKMFPNQLLNDGVSIVCPRALEGEGFECPKYDEDSYGNVLSVCDKCCNEYWLSEVE